MSDFGRGASSRSHPTINATGARVAQNDPRFLRGVDDILLPLNAFTREIDAIAERIRRHLIEHPELRRPIPGPDRNQGSRASRFARRLIAERRQRERLLGSEFFGEPAWDMLLDLFAAHVEGKQISVSSLCIASAVPPTTALRWISSLTQKGVLIRRRDPSDGRRMLIELAPDAFGKMRTLITSWVATSND